MLIRELQKQAAEAFSGQASQVPTYQLPVFLLFWSYISVQFHMPAVPYTCRLKQAHHYRYIIFSTNAQCVFFMVYTIVLSTSVIIYGKHGWKADCETTSIDAGVAFSFHCQIRGGECSGSAVERGLGGRHHQRLGSFTHVYGRACASHHSRCLLPAHLLSPVISAAIINCLYYVSQHTVIPTCTGASLACGIAAAWPCMHCLLVVRELILQ